MSESAHDVPERHRTCTGYPFPIMGGSWGQHFDLVTDLPSRGDTVVGNDVWIGGDVTIMPDSSASELAAVAGRLR